METNEKVLLQVISEGNENESPKVKKEIHKLSDIEENDIVSVKVKKENSEDIDEIIIMGKVLVQEIEKNSGTWDDMKIKAAKSLLKKFKK